MTKLSYLVTSGNHTAKVGTLLEAKTIVENCGGYYKPVYEKVGWKPIQNPAWKHPSFKWARGSCYESKRPKRK